MEVKKLKIVKIINLEKNHFWIEFENKISEVIHPGQFFQIKVDPSLFLRRPFSVGKVTDEYIGILFKTKGKGTSILSKKKPGETLNVLGPLGNGFPLLKKNWKKIWLAGGGTGIAPFIFFTSQLMALKKEFSLFYGARTKQHLFLSLLPGENYPLFISTDDGSSGYKGNIIQIIEKKLKKGEKPDVILAGGPVPVIKQISTIAEKLNIPCYVSLENRMACGMGICYGCVVKIKNKNNWEYKRVCKDGPVFPGNKIIWD